MDPAPTSPRKKSSSKKKEEAVLLHSDGEPGFRREPSAAYHKHTVDGPR